MNAGILYNQPSLKTRRRQLRRNQTDAERVLWAKLRNHQMCGLKFFRQYSIGPYILDFYCPAKRIAVELDGGQHAEDRKDHDERRTAFLAGEQITILRFWNTEVLGNAAGVLSKITEAVGK